MSELFESLLTAHKRALTVMKSNTTNRYPEEFKKVVLETCRKGVSLAKISSATGVNISTLSSWLRKDSIEKDPLRTPRGEPMIPVEWIGGKREEAVIKFKSGTTVSLPVSALSPQLLGLLEKAS